MRQAQITALIVLVASLVGCSGKPVPGPDKQGLGTVTGAASGAGAGAITGFQLGAGTGPGAAIGAGLGAVVGGVQGIAQDSIEDQMMDVADKSAQERARSVAHELLVDHYARRADVYPGRDIFPADVFFLGDEATLKPDARAMVVEWANLNKERLPYSRIAVTAYVKSATPKNEYAELLAIRRAKSIMNELVHSGIEGRRLEARGVLIDKPIALDNIDDPLRYNQAIEFIPVDR